MPGDTYSLVRRYGLALLASVAAVGLDAGLRSSVLIRSGPLVMLSLSMAAVLTASLVCGAGPGLLATALVSGLAVARQAPGPALALGLLGLLTTALAWRCQSKPPPESPAPDAEDRQTETALEQALQKARHDYQSLQQFVAVVGHELRTPLGPVLPAISMLLDSGPPAPVRSTLEMVQRNIELQARLIDDLLDVLRAGCGKLRLAVEPVDVRLLVERAVEICSADFEAGGLRLDVDLDIPDPPPLVQADPTRLLQVLWNLLRNANKFTPRGGQVRLSVRSERPDPADPAGCLVIEVSDTGSGLAPEDLERIFQPFEQAGTDDAGKTSDGLGLGLAISRSIAESHGGRLSASSPGTGQGSRFVLRLPAEFRSRPEQARPRPKSPVPNRLLRILLVEDNDDLRHYLSMALELGGSRVSACKTVLEALGTLESERFDLLISDLELPDGNGRELMKALHDRGCLSAIALSGHGSVEDVDLSLAAGFAVHLTKPVTLSQLETAINQVCGPAAPVG